MSASHPMHRTGPGLTTRSMSTFPLGRRRVRRSGYGAMQLAGPRALQWLLQLAPNVLLIPGTASAARLRENLAAEYVALDDKALRELAGVAV
jgi:hypothetical protein